MKASFLYSMDSIPPPPRAIMHHLAQHLPPQAHHQAHHHQVPATTSTANMAALAIPTHSSPTATLLLRDSTQGLIAVHHLDIKEALHHQEAQGHHHQTATLAHIHRQILALRDLIHLVETILRQGPNSSPSLLATHHLHKEDIHQVDTHLLQRLPLLALVRMHPRLPKHLRPLHHLLAAHKV